MKRAAVGDIHLDGFEEDVLDKEGLPQRLGRIMFSLKFIIDKCKSLGITNIDFLGDIVHTKSLISTVALDYFKDLILNNPNISFTMFSGNHDLSSTGETQKSAVSVFKGYRNVNCFELDHGNLTNSIYVIPYCENFLDVIKVVQGFPILLTHIGLNEGKLESGLSKMANVSLSHLKNFKLVLAGHYHTPQFIENNITKFWYAGSISNLSWSDKNQTKRFLVYDDETLKVESIPIDGQIQYREIILDKVEDVKKALEEAERLKNNGHNVRIKKVMKEDIEHAPSDILIIEKKEIDITNRGITITQTLNEKLKKYLEIKQIPEDKRQSYLNILEKNNILTKV